MPRVKDHGRIRPRSAADFTCAECDKQVQPNGKDEAGEVRWRHVAPGRTFTGRSSLLPVPKPKRRRKVASVG